LAAQKVPRVNAIRVNLPFPSTAQTWSTMPRLVLRELGTQLKPFQKPPVLILMPFAGKLSRSKPANAATTVGCSPPRTSTAATPTPQSLGFRLPTRREITYHGKSRTLLADTGSLQSVVSSGNSYAWNMVSAKMETWRNSRLKAATARMCFSTKLVLCEKTF
jgi:hypothetical protein